MIQSLDTINNEGLTRTGQRLARQALRDGGISSLYWPGICLDDAHRSLEGCVLPRAGDEPGPVGLVGHAEFIWILLGAWLVCCLVRCPELAEDQPNRNDMLSPFRSFQGPPHATDRLLEVTLMP